MLPQPPRAHIADYGTPEREDYYKMIRKGNRKTRKVSASRRMAEQPEVPDKTNNGGQLSKNWGKPSHHSKDICHLLISQWKDAPFYV